MELRAILSRLIELYHRLEDAEALDFVDESELYRRIDAIAAELDPEEDRLVRRAEDLERSLPEPSSGLLRAYAEAARIEDCTYDDDLGFARERALEALAIELAIDRAIELRERREPRRREREAELDADDRERPEREREMIEGIARALAVPEPDGVELGLIRVVGTLSLPRSRIPPARLAAIDDACLATLTFRFDLEEARRRVADAAKAHELACTPRLRVVR